MNQIRHTIIAFIMVLCFAPCYAKYKTYCTVDNNTYITTAPDARLYELSDKQSATNVREFIDIQNSKIKKLRKPQQLRVLRLTNTSKQLTFNAYIVEHKDNLWVLQDGNVQDNSILKEKSAKILQHRKELEEKYIHLNSQYDSLTSRINGAKLHYDSLVAKYTSLCTDSITYYKKLKAQIPHIKDSLVSAAEAREQDRVNRLYKQWYDALPASTKRVADIISITEAGLSSPNSAGGCDYYFCYQNKSKKAIKYLYWTGTVYNAVNDPAYCDIRRTATYKGKDTGPVGYGESGGGGWDCVVYNYSADTMKLSNIRIVYMDGSSTSIAAADIRRLFEEPSTKVYVSTYDITNKVISEHACQNRIKIWEERLNNAKKQKFDKGSYEEYFNDKPDSTLNEIRSAIRDCRLKLDNMGNDVETKRNEAMAAHKEYENFDKFVNFEVYSDSKSGSSYSNYVYSSSNKLNSKNSKKSPFVTLGLEGSIEGLKSFSTGWGASVRIGRFNSVINATIGVKYQYTSCNQHIWYVYSDPNSYHVYSGDADYKQRAHQLVVPIAVNWNPYRDDKFAYFIGIGYEHGFLSATTRKYENLSYDFSEEHMVQSGDCEDVTYLSTPSRTVIFQTGLSGRHWDWKVYYKLYANKSKFTNGDPGAIGTAFVYYF
ncbi:MAG: hypothetical protein IKL20_05435 [Alistipes sp.]|nr:hypothetical protein [Alistipes sp.]